MEKPTSSPIDNLILGYTILDKAETRSESIEGNETRSFIITFTYQCAQECHSKKNFRYRPKLMFAYAFSYLISLRTTQQPYYRIDQNKSENMKSAYYHSSIIRHTAGVEIEIFTLEKSRRPIIKCIIIIDGNQIHQTSMHRLPNHCDSRRTIHSAGIISRRYNCINSFTNPMILSYLHVLFISQK